MIRNNLLTGQLTDVAEVLPLCGYGQLRAHQTVFFPGRVPLHLSALEFHLPFYYLSLDRKIVL